MSAFANMKALSERNDEPTKASRPFDAGRDGFVLAEGAGILIFEELEHAEPRAPIYGGSDGLSAPPVTPDTSPNPRMMAAGAARAMSIAIEDAGFNLGQDRLHQRPRHQHTAGRQSGNEGHQERVWRSRQQAGDQQHQKPDRAYSGASGGIEMVICVKSINDDTVPPTINLETADPDCDLDYTPNIAAHREAERAP